jgi:hypothetical protein
VVGTPRFQLLAAGWDSVRVRVGHATRFSVVARHWQRRAVQLEGWSLGARGSSPVSLAALSLPEQLDLTADTTRVTWTAALPAGSDDSTLVLLVRIAEPDPCAASVAVMGEHARVAAVGEAPAPRDGLRVTRDGRQWALVVSLATALPEARIELFDTQGRRVRRLLTGPLPAGFTRVRWDGRDDGCTALAPGLYFARLSSARLRATARLVRLR